MPKKKAICFHVLLIGDKNVGKYSLKEQFIKGWIAPKDFQAPPGSTSKVLVIEKKKIEVSVSHVKVLENADEIKNCDGVILVYNISEKKSIDYIRNQAVPFLQGTSKADDTAAPPGNGQQQEGGGETNDIGKPLVLVGNKADEAKLSRKVDSEDGEKLSSELKCAGFFETSATCNENVQKAFLCLVEKILEKHIAENPEAGKRKKSGCAIS